MTIIEALQILGICIDCLGQSGNGPATEDNRCQYCATMHNTATDWQERGRY